ncbi:type II toxin-antitoxin system VapC family toxin [Cyanobium sp. FGCU-6]|nr:type II toxin-antitoxin system VapC family toxin [Cyanobium sp. FGCU6]
MAFLLDTNILVAAIKGHPAVVEALRSLTPSDLLLSSVVLGELETGVIKSAWPERNRLQLLALVDHLELVPVDRAVALAYAQIRASLERQGTPIGANDLWIAAQAQALNAVLVTDNTREFSRVEGLALVNWLR